MVDVPHTHYYGDGCQPPHVDPSRPVDLRDELAAHVLTRVLGHPNSALLSREAWAQTTGWWVDAVLAHPRVVRALTVLEAIEAEQWECDYYGDAADAGREPYTPLTQCTECGHDALLHRLRRLGVDL